MCIALLEPGSAYMGLVNEQNQVVAVGIIISVDDSTLYKRGPEEPTMESQASL